MSQLLSPEQIKQQERMVRILQGQTFFLYLLSVLMSLSPLIIKMDRALNFFLLGLSPVLAYGGIESAHKLREKERTYCTAKDLLIQAIAKQYSVEISTVTLLADHKFQQLHASLMPQPVMQAAPPAHQLPPQRQAVEQNQTEEQSQQAPAIDYGPMLVDALAEHQVSVSYAGRLDGSAFDRYLLKKEKGATFAKIEKLGKELQLDLGLEVEPLIGIHEGCIGVDIPRKQRNIYYYKDYIKPGHRPTEDGLWIPIGMSLGGKLIEIDLSDPDTCHILGGGATGSGKSVWLRVAAQSLCDRYSPEEVQLILCDFGRASFGGFDDIPHLHCPVLKDLKSIIQMLSFLVEEMEARKDLLDQYGVPHLTALNKVLEKPLPRLVTFTDEYAAEIEAATPEQRKAIESYMIRLSLEARKVGIHLITFMQRPEEAYLDGQVRSNHPASVCLKVKRAEDSKMVLGEGGLGGEKLLGKGDLLFSAGGVVQRLQALCLEAEGNAERKPRAAQATVVDVHTEEVGDEYAYRYPDNWQKISREAKLMTGGVCCFPGCKHEATETHHAQYERLDRNGEMISICDDPEPGEDVFPLCDEHHRNRSNPECAHHKSNWVYGACEFPKEIDSRNTPAYHALLRRGWKEKTAKFEKFIRAKLEQVA